MKTLIIYNSQTGFTKKYAEWLGERMQATVMNLKEAKKEKDGFYKDFDAIAFGSWVLGGKAVKAEWFLEKAPVWKGKKLVQFMVGAMPGDAPEIQTILDNALNDEQKRYIKVFFCQGGLDYTKMKFPYKQMMKAFSSMTAKKAVTEDEKKMAEMIASNYDESDPKFIEPIVAYLEGGE